MITPGTTLGSYRIERQLGRGGMGAVFLAYDTTLHRQVALKAVDEGDDGPASRDRLLREARNAAALNHPHICTVHEVRHDAGTTVIAMEYVEGHSLRDRKPFRASGVPELFSAVLKDPPAPWSRRRADRDSADRRTLPGERSGAPLSERPRGSAQPTSGSSSIPRAVTRRRLPPIRRGPRRTRRREGPRSPQR